MLDICERENLLTRGTGLAEYWAEQLHSLRGEPGVIDIRNIGLIGGIELEAKAYEIFVDCFRRGLLIRVTNEIIALSPPLILGCKDIDEIIEILRASIRNVAQ